MRLFLLLTLLGICGPAFAAGPAAILVGTGTKTAAEKRAACALYFASLPGAYRKNDIAFLPDDLQAEVRDRSRFVAAARREEAAGQPYSFHPELNATIKRLQTERRARVARGEALATDEIALRTAPQTAETKARMAELQAAMEKNTDEIESIGRMLTPMRQTWGLGAFTEAAKAAAKEQNGVMVLPDFHAAATGLLTHKATGKIMKFKFNSTDSGVIAGLIPYDQSLSEKVVEQGAQVLAEKQAKVEDAIAKGLVKKVPMRVGSLVAVKRNGTTVFVDTHRVKVADSDIAWILEEIGPDTAGTHRLIVSDVDPVAFGFPPPPAGKQDVLHTTGAMGVRTVREERAIKSFNDSAARLLESTEQRNRYMTHGAEARNPASPGIKGFPLWAFFPDGTVRKILQGPAGDPLVHYREAVQEAASKGYDLTMNPLWK